MSLNLAKLFISTKEDSKILGKTVREVQDFYNVQINEVYETPYKNNREMIPYPAYQIAIHTSLVIYGEPKNLARIIEEF